MTRRELGNEIAMPATTAPHQMAAKSGCHLNLNKGRYKAMTADIRSDTKVAKRCLA